MEAAAAKLQLEELEQRKQFILDEKLALKIFLEDSGTDDEGVRRLLKA